MGPAQENIESHALILQKLDDQRDAIKELKQDIRDVRDDLTELKTNHLSHLSADVFILKDHFKTHQQGHAVSGRSQWKVWVAFITGICGIMAAAVASLVK
jgi:hypothetical protein